MTTDLSLAVGDRIPDLTLLDDSGAEVPLRGLRGTRVALYLYPRDNTSGCTAQACGLRDDWSSFEALDGIAVFGVSPDDAASHAAFRAQHDLPFPLLVDEDHRLADAIGCWVEKQNYGRTYFGVERTTVIIAPDGMIEAIARNVKPSEHTAWLREQLAAAAPAAATAATARGPVPRRLQASMLRRALVRGLMRATEVPIARPLAQLGARVLFDRIADDWERIRANATYRGGFSESLELIPTSVNPGFVVDVACGTGLATALLAERWPDADVVGTDISPRMIERAEQLVPTATFAVASAHDLPFLDHSVDLIAVLDGIIDPAELMRVLHPAGRILIVYSRRGETPVSRSLGELVDAFERVNAVATQHRDGQSHALVVKHA